MMIRSAMKRNGKYRKAQEEANRRKTNKAMMSAKNQRLDRILEETNDIQRGVKLPPDVEVR